MKRFVFTIIAAMMMTIQLSAMSYAQARNQALFLTDKMAYELNLTDEQYEAAYEINLDYLMGVSSYDDVFGNYWTRRNLDLSYILLDWQWNAFRSATYFYRPLYWDAGYWHFSIYARYPHRDYFYFGRPVFYASYRGGHSWRMNGNRSFYYNRRDHYRNYNENRGMRNGWDRGEFRNGNFSRGRNSSTRTTVNSNRNYENRTNEKNNQNRFGANRASGVFSNNRNYDNNSNSNVNRNNSSQGTFSNSHSNGSFRSSSPRNQSIPSNNGSFGARRSNNTSSFGTTSTSPSMRSGGSFGNNTRSNHAAPNNAGGNGHFGGRR